jgi:ABC-type branched-subunit amino acid transport system ATPase component
MVTADSSGRSAAEAAGPGAAGRRPGPAGPGLTIEDLSAGYATAIVSGVSFSVRGRDIVALIGPNGAGKSTVLKAVIGQSRIFSGRVGFGGQDITGISTERLIRLGIGYVPQVDDVFPTLSVEENLLLGAYTLASRARRAALPPVYEIFPALTRLRQRVVYKLSGGERKLVALGRALMTQPDLLVLDEPTSNLAPVIADEILGEYLPRLTSAGKMILIVEQRVQALRGLCDRVVVLGRGKVIASGTDEEVFSHPQIVEFLAGSYQAPQ